LESEGMMIKTELDTCKEEAKEFKAELRLRASLLEQVACRIHVHIRGITSSLTRAHSHTRCIHVRTHTANIFIDISFSCLALSHTMHAKTHTKEETRKHTHTYYNPYRTTSDKVHGTM